VADGTPPVITIISPLNTTYTTTTVPLTYRVDEEYPDWAGYSLDGAANVTLSGNTTLSGLSLSPHSLAVYANDTSGNMAKKIVYFTVAGSDETSPVVDIISPSNATYTTTSIPLEYKVDEDYPDWTGYSLDGAANVTLTGNVTLSGLTYGPHSVTVYANDTSGNWGKDTVYFTTEDATPSIVTIISPLNTMYTASSVPLEYSVNEPTAWVGYSLDGAANVTLSGNTTLSGLSLGSHALAVYANDTSGNWGLDTVSFTVSDATSPVVVIVSPMNSTYYITDVSLEYKVEEEYPDWVGYSLDGAANVTLVGNTTLSGLSYSSHRITVYANDTSGNWGLSTIWFKVEKDVTPPTVSIISPMSKTYTVTSTPTSIPLTYTIDEPTDWQGYSLDGAANVTLTGNTVLSGLSQGSHSLSVYANDTSGNWGSDSVSFTIKKKTIPIINWPPKPVTNNDPTNITGDSMSLSWTRNEDFDFRKYVVYCSTSFNDLGQKVDEITDKSDTTYQMTGLAEGTTYYCIVRVYDSGGLFSDSNQVSGKTNSPPNPVILSDPTEITNASMSLSWTRNEDSDFDKYVLYCSTSQGLVGQKVVETSDRSDTSHEVTGLSDNTTYYCVVRVYDSGGLSSDSNQVSARTEKTIPPDNRPPVLTILSPTNTTYGESSVELTWLTNEPLSWAGYSLNGGAITTISGNLTIADLENAEYVLELIGTDLAGNNGSDVVAFTIYTVVPDTESPEITHTPVTGVVEATPIEISAIITDETGVSEAWLYYRKGGITDYALLEMLSSGGDAYTAMIPASFVDDEKIEYYILASDGVNEATHPSVDPTAGPHVVDVDLYPDPVALYRPASAAITVDSVELTWSESYEADFRNYVVYMSGSEGVLGDILKEEAERSETSYTVEELEADTTYYFSVRAYDTGGLYSDSNQLEVHTGIRRVIWTTNLFVFLLVLLPLGVGGAYYYIRKKRVGANPGEILT
jgi:hypothetical protein